jgi:signal peptidase II
LQRYVRDYLILVPPAAILVAVDQWTKWLVSTSLGIGEAWAPWPWLLPYARIIHWANTGSAFGMFQGLGNVFAVLAVLVSLFILYYFPRIEPRDWLVRLALILQLGGAVGNLVDRIRQGHVTDFISVGNFAVFNVADSCISVGVVVLMLGMYLKDNRERQNPADPGVEGQPPESAEHLVRDGQSEG